jgi:exodeoxyribonuclease VII large subunit
MLNPTPVLTVSQLNRQVRSWLEHEMGTILVEGEISNLSKPASGHFYFTLKDPTAQLRCVYFRNRHDNTQDVQNGQQVRAQGNLSLYEARGDYQLIVEQLHEAGEGDLYRQFELLKAKLAALGLFDPARKKTLPRFPDCVGVITSASGAALRDIITTLGRRFPFAHVVVYASEVQGKQAAQQLTKALNLANYDKRCDVLILARGGGSIEDLWAFNDEHLAHAIANSRIPIVSGVGHETDFTIADFVADLRAATPTAAAEAVTPNMIDVIALFQTYETRLLRAIHRFIQHQQLLLQHQTQKLTSPRQLISAYWQSLDFLRNHLQHALQKLFAQKRQSLHAINNRLDAKNPVILLQKATTNLQSLEHALFHQLSIKINKLRQEFTNQLATLHAVSPLATLDRGYAIATCNNKIVIDSQSVNLGDTINIRLAKGQLVSKIISKEDNKQVLNHD